MLNQWGHVGILVLLAVLFPMLPLIISLLFRMLGRRPQNPDVIKTDMYECGMETEGGDAWGQFHVRYFVIALIFLVFDVEVLFLFPWAVSMGALGWGGFVAVLIFTMIISVGFAYDWKKGGLDWE
jgi:NADH-quinone oxidoreductase subunit A